MHCLPTAPGQPHCPYQRQHAWNVGLWKLSPPLPAPLWGSSSPTTATGQPEPTPSTPPPHLQPRGSGLLVVTQGPSPCSPAGIAQTPQAPLPRDNPTRQRETPAGAPYAERTPKGGPKPGFELRAAQPCRQPPGPPGSGSTGPGLQGQKGRATTVRGPLCPQGLGKGPLSAPEPDPRALSQAAVCPPLK